MSAPSGPRRRYVEVNTLNEQQRQTEQAGERKDRFLFELFPLAAGFFFPPFLFVFNPPPGLLSLSW